MMRVFVYIFCFLCLSHSVAYGLEPVHVRFISTYAGQPVVLEEKWYPLAGGDSLLLETIRFYISDVCFFKDGKVVYREPDSYHLVDCAAEPSTAWTLSMQANTLYDAIGFNLGLDSLTNVSGAQGGALDPSNGMYWAWQSGYINLKLEGKSNLCPTRKNIFQFHLGGYMQRDYAMQRVQLPAGSGDIVIRFPVDKLLAATDLRIQNSVMIPCPEAVQMAAHIAKLFEVQDK